MEYTGTVYSGYLLQQCVVFDLYEVPFSKVRINFIKKKTKNLPQTKRPQESWTRCLTMVHFWKLAGQLGHLGFPQVRLLYSSLSGSLCWPHLHITWDPAVGQHCTLHIAHAARVFQVTSRQRHILSWSFLNGKGIYCPTENIRGAPAIFAEVVGANGPTWRIMVGWFLLLPIKSISWRRTGTSTMKSRKDGRTFSPHATHWIVWSLPRGTQILFPQCLREINVGSSIWKLLFFSPVISMPRCQVHVGFCKPAEVATASRWGLQTSRAPQGPFITMVLQQGQESDSAESFYKMMDDQTALVAA